MRTDASKLNNKPSPVKQNVQKPVKQNKPQPVRHNIQQNKKADWNSLIEIDNKIVGNNVPLSKPVFKKTLLKKKLGSTK